MLQDENPAAQMLSRDSGSNAEFKIQYENVRYFISDFKLRSRKPSGSKHQVQDNREVWSLLGTEASTIQPLVRRKVWSTNMFSLQNRWRWWLLARKCDLFTSLWRMWWWRLSILRRDWEERIFERCRASQQQGGRGCKQVGPETSFYSPSRRQGGC